MKILLHLLQEAIPWGNPSNIIFKLNCYRGVHGAISPQITNETFVPFDDTPGIFDNHVFHKSLRSECALPIDCDIASDPELRPIVER